VGRGDRGDGVGSVIGEVGGRVVAEGEIDEDEEGSDGAGGGGKRGGGERGVRLERGDEGSCEREGEVGRDERMNK